MVDRGPDGDTDLGFCFLINLRAWNKESWSPGGEEQTLAVAAKVSL